MPGRLTSGRRRARGDRVDQPLGGLGGDAGGVALDDGALAGGVGVVDPVVEAAAAERVVQLARAVGGEDRHHRLGGADGADLGDGDLEVGEELQEEGLEGVVGAVDLVDEEDGGVRRAERLEERHLDEELGGVEVGGVDRAGALGDADVQELADVVPVVEGAAGVDALVALQADAVAAEDAGQ